MSLKPPKANTPLFKNSITDFAYHLLTHVPLLGNNVKGRVLMITLISLINISLIIYLGYSKPAFLISSHYSIKEQPANPKVVEQIKFEKYDELSGLKTETDPEVSQISFPTIALNIEGKREVGELLILEIENFDSSFSYIINFGNGTQRIADKKTSFTYMKKGIYEINVQMIHPMGRNESFKKILVIQKVGPQSIIALGGKNEAYLLNTASTHHNYMKSHTTPSLG